MNSKRRHHIKLYTLSCYKDFWITVLVNTFDSGTPEHGYGSILPRHTSDHGMRHLDTTHKTDFQWQGEWNTEEEKKQVH